MLKFNVIPGDISQVKADALITAINPDGEWKGGIDDVIRRNAGTLFHSQAAEKLPLKQGQTVNAKGGPSNRASFSNVVFVIDGPQGSLSDVIFNGLMAADEAGYKSVTLPAIRMGVMRGVVEKTIPEAVWQIIDGIQRFDKKDDFKPTLQEVTFVIYGDEEVTQELYKITRSR